MKNWYSLFSRKPSFYAWITGILAAVVFLPTVARDAVPGDSAVAVALFSGADQLDPLSHWLWGTLGRIFDTFPAGTLGYRWNLLSAFFGIGNCVLVFHIAAHLMRNRPGRDILSSQNTEPPGNLAGLAAALFLMFCLPYRLVSTTASPATFEIFLFLSSCWTLLRYRESKNLRHVYAAVALFGISVTQYNAAIAAAPFWGILLLYALVKNRALTAKTCLLLAGIFAASLTLLLIEALMYLRTPSFQWSDLDGLGGLIMVMLRDKYAQIRHGVPPTGITIVLLFSIAPFILYAFVPRKNEWSYYLLLTIGLTLCTLMFFLYPFTPWQLFGYRPLLIAPYVLSAIAAGGLFVQGLSIIPDLWFVVRRKRNKWLKQGLEAAALAAIACIMLLSAVINHRQLSISPALFITRFASDLVSRVESGTWLIADNQLDPLLRIKAREQDKDIFIISASRFSQKLYQKALCAQIDDERLCNMAAVGFIPFLREAFHPARDNPPVLAMIGERDVSSFLNQPVRPEHAMYVTKWNQEESADDYLARQLIAWTYYGQELPVSGSRPNAHTKKLLEMRQSFSRAANDAGVWLDEAGRDDLARTAYRASIELWTNNLSARLNLQQLISPEEEASKRLADEIDYLSSLVRGKVELHQIVQSYGTIKHPEVIASEALRWSRSGNSVVAEDTLEIAIRGNDDEAYKMLMASIASSKGAREKSEQILTEVAEQNTNNVAVLIALAQIAASQGRGELALRFIDDVRPRVDNPRLVDVEAAFVLLNLNRREEAYELLISLADASVKDPRIWAMLALITADTRPLEADQYLDKLEAFPQLVPQFYLPLARLCQLRGRPDDARRHVINHLEIRPMDRDALHFLLGIDMRAGRIRYTMPVIKQLLQMDARDPRAQYALGAYHYQNGDLEAARVAWETSLEEASAPDTLNDYAYLLYQTGESEKALAYVEDSLKAQPSPAAFLTKASVLMDLQRTEEAEKTISAGMEAFPDNALLQERKLSLIDQ